MSIPFSSTTTATRPPNHISSFSFESISSTNNSRSNSINSLLYLNSSNSSMGSNPAQSPTSIAATATPSNTIHHLISMSTTTTTAQQQQQQQQQHSHKQHGVMDEDLEDPSQAVVPQPNQTPTLMSTASYTLQRPPGLQHNYQSSISSVSSTSSNSTNSSLSPGLINYSPKHSRKPSSLTMNRNMKNLSLNLQESTNGYTKNLPKLASSNSTSFLMNNNNNSRQKIPNIESPIKKNMTNYYNLDYTALQTPTITETPKCPHYYNNNKIL